LNRAQKLNIRSTNAPPNSNADFRSSRVTTEHLLVAVGSSIASPSMNAACMTHATCRIKRELNTPCFKKNGTSKTAFFQPFFIGMEPVWSIQIAHGALVLVRINRNIIFLYYSMMSLRVPLRQLFSANCAFGISLHYYFERAGP